MPKAIRDRLGIRPGSKLVFELDPDDSLRVRVLSRGSAGLFGLLARPDETPRSIDEMNAAVGAAIRERHQPDR